MKHSLKNIFFTLILLIVTLIFVLVSLFVFQSRIQKREYEVNLRSLVDFSTRSSSIMEDHFYHYIGILRSIAEFLQGSDFQSEHNLQTIGRILDDPDNPFTQIGISSFQGDTVICSKFSSQNSYLSLDPSKYPLFTSAIKSGYAIMDDLNPENHMDGLIYIAVPIRDHDNRTEGFLFASVESNRFFLHGNSPVPQKSRSVQLIDQKGNYILKSSAESPFVGDNLFEQLNQVKTSKAPEDIIWNIQNGEPILTQAQGPNNHFIVYFSPLEIAHWSLVTVINRKDIALRIDQLLENDLYLLIVEVSAAVLFFCGAVILFLLREKKEVVDLCQKLQLKEETLMAAVSNTTALIMTYDPSCDVLRIINPDMMKLSLPAVVERATENMPLLLPMTPKTLRQLQVIHDYLHSNSLDSASFELYFSIGSQDLFYNIILKAVENDEDHKIQYIITAEDTTETSHLRQEVRYHEQLLSGMLGFVIIDMNSDLVLQSSENLRYSYPTGVSFSSSLKEAIQAFILKDYWHYVFDSFSLDDMNKKYDSGIRDFILEYPCQRLPDQVLWLECEVHMEKESESSHLLVYTILRNIDQKKRRELILQEQADLDSLTKLYNRRSASELINSFLQSQKESHTHIHAFLILDLDNFKSLNDTLGHSMGDKALQDVADVLRQHFRPYDILCRLAGDEFVLLIKDVPLAAIPRIMESLLNKLKLTYQDETHQVQISASAGISLAPWSGTTFHELYCKADKALYEVKRTRKGSFALYRED